MLSGHESAVYSAAYSPDGTHIVTASQDQAARIWDARTGTQLAAISGHSDRVNSARYSPDGTTIVTASADQTTRIWDAHIEASVSDQIIWSLAAETDSLSEFDRTQLGIPPDVWVRQWPNPGSACDQAAAAWYDPARLARGTPLEEISVETAKLSCASEARLNRGGRSEFQLGRAMLAQGDLSDSIRYLKTSVSRGYRAAQIDLADALLSAPKSLDDIRQAVLLYERAWRDGIGVAAFRLGQLYERGLAVTSASGDVNFPARTTQAWSWYENGAAAGEPNSLARFAERAEQSALTDRGTERNADLYRSFLFYAAAGERAGEEAWPDPVWRHWRYRRASLARVLGSEVSMHDVAVAYSAVLDKSRRGDPTPWRSVVAQWGR